MSLLVFWALIIVFILVIAIIISNFDNKFDTLKNRLEFETGLTHLNLV